MLLLEDVGGTNKTAMFLSLLFRAMRADVSTKRLCAFVKRLLQVALHQQPNFACGCLLLTSQLLQARPHVPDNAACVIAASAVADVPCVERSCCCPPPLALLFLKRRACPQIQPSHASLVRVEVLLM
jgi:hypothetical protein